MIRRHKAFINKEGYRQVYAPKSSEARDNGYAPEHRLVVSKKLGRPLRDGEVVHHIDGDKQNNRAKNLQVMTRAEHYKLHHFGVSKSSSGRNGRRNSRRNKSARG